MVQDDMTELMVEIVNVFDILERGRLRKKTSFLRSVRE